MCRWWMFERTSVTYPPKKKEKRKKGLHFVPIITFTNILSIITLLLPYFNPRLQFYHHQENITWSVYWKDQAQTETKIILTTLWQNISANSKKSNCKHMRVINVRKVFSLYHFIHASTNILTIKLLNKFQPKAAIINFKFQQLTWLIFFMN